MTAVDAAQKVRFLIDRACSDRSDAPDAAREACALIKRYDLVVTTKATADQFPRPQEARKASAPAVDGRYIEAKFDSRCASCGEQLYAGDEVYWVPGDGVYCTNCN